MLTTTIVKFVHEVSSSTEEIQSSTQPLASPTHVIQSRECASDRPLSRHGNVSLFHVLSMLNWVGDQQDSLTSVMLETPSIGGTRRNVTLNLNQVTPNIYSPPTSTSESSVNIDNSHHSPESIRAFYIFARSSGTAKRLEGGAPASTLHRPSCELGMLPWQDCPLN
jgi:hypothetical protein